MLSAGILTRLRGDPLTVCFDCGDEKKVGVWQGCYQWFSSIRTINMSAAE